MHKWASITSVFVFVYNPKISNKCLEVGDPTFEHSGKPDRFELL